MYYKWVSDDAQYKNFIIMINILKIPFWIAVLQRKLSYNYNSIKLHDIILYRNDLT